MSGAAGTAAAAMPLIVRADAGRLPLPDRSVDLVAGSPPYVDARLYLEGGRDLGISRDAHAWVDWMLGVTAECLRVSRGPVIWVAAGVTRGRTYWPACEGLMWRWFAEGWGEHGAGTHPVGSAYRPCYWHRVGIPGSGGDQWYRADVEYAMCFKRPGPLPFAEPTANGHAPKWAPGGEMSHRIHDGKRVNAFGVRRDGVWIGATRPNGKKYSEERDAPHTRADRVHTKRLPSGEMAEQGYNVPVLANPGNVLKTTVGGNLMGHDLAHANEAPFPEAVPRFFVRSHCPPGGLVLDPFGGSGTTAAAAILEGRRAVLADLRQSQCELARRRIGDPATYGIRQNPSLDAPRPPAPLPGQMALFDGEEVAS